jgi:uridine kinase
MTFKPVGVLALCATLTAFVRRGEHSVILIGGAGSLGKSTFAERLAQHITEAAGLTVSVLDLDCYLMPRNVRETNEQIVSGYNPAEYHLDQAGADIRRLLAGQTIAVSPYDNVTSQKGSEVPITPGSVLIIEGVMALTEPVREFGTIGVFVAAPREVLYHNRRARELGLGFEPERIERKFAILSDDYTRYIAEQMQHAHILVDVGMNSNFSSITLRIV